MVVGNKSFTDLTKPSEIVQLLLNEDQLANLNSGNVDPSQSLSGQPITNGSMAVSREFWNEEGDDFFTGATSTAPGNAGGTPLDIIEDEAGAGNATKKKRAKPRKPRAKQTGDTTPKPRKSKKAAAATATSTPAES